MIDSMDDLVSDSEGKNFNAYIMGTSPDYRLSSLGHNQLEPETVPLFDDSDLERVFENSLEEGTSLSRSLEALLY